MQPSQLPLTSLRALEASARLLSFKSAAAELNVTPTAVSHQIQYLEGLLGVQLFERVHRGLVLTPAGAACLPYLQTGFESLCHAVQLLQRYPEDREILVSAPPSFTTRLLMPTTHQYLALHPDVDLNITTRMRAPMGSKFDMQDDSNTLLKWAENTDLVIVYGQGEHPDLEAEELLPLSISLLCSPSLLTEGPALAGVDDVFKFRWLHDERGTRYGQSSFWSLWLSAAGLKADNPSHGIRFTHASLAIDAAVDGAGLLVTTPALCVPELQTGRLVSPFSLTVDLGLSYVVLNRRSVRPAVQELKRWLISRFRDAI